MALTLKSPAFADGQRIPVKYTRDGDNLSPPLEWSGAPGGTKSFVLVVEDPDAPGGTYTHWGVFDIPPDRTGLEEGAGSAPADGMKFAVNDFGNARYDGPEPPRGHGVHHYHFRLGAMSVASLPFKGKPAVKQIWGEAKKHLLASAEIVGTYER